MTPTFSINPDNAWFSGYRISYETWCQWVVTLPQPESSSPYKPGDHHGFYYLAFWLEWLDLLPSETRKQLPKVRFEEGPGDTILAVFFPLRWVEYKSRRQVDPGASKYNASICEENPSDRARLRKFLKLLRQQGAPLDKDKIEFGWLKEVHPRDEYRCY